MIPQAELDAAPNITLGGIDYPIPMLVPRQQRFVIPRMMGLMQEMTKGGAVFDPKLITTQLYDDLLYVTHLAITRARPDLTYDQFLDLPCELMDLVASIDVIAKQTGMISRAKAGAPQTGEVVAGTSQTGTASLPE
jgi:hypothetical protein